jgi:4a-hydroxytetrahydrobiopterin dehydratase
MSEEQLRAELPKIKGWELRDGKLHKTFQFADFIQAWGFMSRVALIAQAMDHHPDWSNVYKTVTVDLSTHDAGGVTSLDLELARKMDQNA